MNKIALDIFIVLLVTLSVTAVTTKTEVYSTSGDIDIYKGDAEKLGVDDCSLESELLSNNEFVRYNFGDRSHTFNESILIYETQLDEELSFASFAIILSLVYLSPIWKFSLDRCVLSVKESRLTNGNEK